MLEPIPKPVPAPIGVSQGKSIGTIYHDAVPVFVCEQVLERILDYSEKNLSRESGGFLVGGLHQDRTVFVELRHFLPAADARGRAGSLVFTHDTWSTMTRQVEERFPDDLVIGWHHTHPDFGVFLSGYDRFIHRHFFNQPWQIALVVDPCRHELGFFQWRGTEVDNCGFTLVPREGMGCQ